MSHFTEVFKIQSTPNYKNTLHRNCIFLASGNYEGKVYDFFADGKDVNAKLYARYGEQDDAYKAHEAFEFTDDKILQIAQRLYEMSLNEGFFVGRFKANLRDTFKRKLASGQKSLPTSHIDAVFERAVNILYTEKLAHITTMEDLTNLVADIYLNSVLNTIVQFQKEAGKND